MNHDSSSGDKHKKQKSVKLQIEEYKFIEAFVAHGMSMEIMQDFSKDRSNLNCLGQAR